MRNNYLGLIGFLSLTVILAGCSTSQGTAKLNQSEAPASSAAMSDEPAATEEAAAISAAEQPADSMAADTAAAPTADAAAPASDAAAPAADAAPAGDATGNTATAATDTAASPAEPVADAAPAAIAPAAAPAATAEAPSDAQIAAKLLPLPPEGVIKTVRKLTKHPRVLYMSNKAQYNYYVGGEFNAEYNPGKQLFTISNDGREGKPVTCRYGKDGELLGKKEADADTVQRCGELVHTLSNYLSN